MEHGSRAPVSRPLRQVSGSGMVTAMGLPWLIEQRSTIEDAMRRFPAESGKCAALARVVLGVAQPVDPDAMGIQVKPRTAAPYILPKNSRGRCWHSHTLVRTQAHHVDVLTGADGCEHQRYLEEYFQYPEALQLLSVDVLSVDVGIQNVEE